MGLAFSPEGSSHVRYHVRSDVRSGQLAGTLKRPVHRGFRRLMLGMLGLLRKKIFSAILCRFKIILYLCTIAC